MTSSPSVFARKEVKYLVASSEQKALIDVLSDHLPTNGQNGSLVTSLYYDTPQWDLIERSLEKPLYKEKLRVRVYGTEAPHFDTEAFVELKTKYKGIVYKRRVGCLFGQALSLLNGETLTRSRLAGFLGPEKVQYRDYQILHEIASFVQRYPGLVPSMAIACRRVAFESSEGVRVTFDSQVRYLNTRAAEKAPWKRVFTDDTSIMEVKVPQSYPFWLTEALNTQGIYPCSFSKYGTAYQKEMFALEGSSCA